MEDRHRNARGPVHFSSVTFIRLFGQLCGNLFFLFILDSSNAPARTKLVRSICFN